MKSRKAKGKAEGVKPKAKSKRAMPHFGKAPEALVRTFESAMKDFPMVQQRKTFGYPSAFVNGNMFAGLHNENMILRLSPEDAAKLQGAKQFEPMPGRPMKGWVTVPRAVLDSASELNAWMERAMEFTRGLPAKRKR